MCLCLTELAAAYLVYTLKVGYHCAALNICIVWFRCYALHSTHLQVSTISLNKEYSRYDGTEVIEQVLSPPESSNYMFKNSENGVWQVVAPASRVFTHW